MTTIHYEPRKRWYFPMAKHLLTFSKKDVIDALLVDLWPPSSKKRAKQRGQ